MDPVRARQTGSRWAPVARSLCIALLIAQAILPSTARASDDNYDAQWHQLDQLVQQRAALMAQLADADGTAGALLARDVVLAIRPVFAAQDGLVAAGLHTAERDPFAPEPAVPVRDRSAGPGVLLGAHMPVPHAGPHIPARTPQLVQQATLRQNLLAAPALSLGQAAATSASGTSRTATEALALSPATLGANLPDLDAALPASALSSLAALSARAAATPPTYAMLGAAQDLAPVHSIVAGGRVLRVVDVAPQSVAHAPPAPLVPLPPASPPAVRGLIALQGYSVAASMLHSTFGSITPPTALPSAGIDAAQRVTNLDSLQAQLGHYDLSIPLDATSIVPATALTPAIAPQVTWAFSATVPLRGGGPSLLLVGGGHANGGSVHDLQLAAFAAPTGLSTAAAPGTHLSLQFGDDGTGTLSAVTSLADTTTISTTVQIDSLAQDTALQAALGRERLALTELAGIVPAGDALYARLQPLYEARVQQYNLQVSAVIAQNTALEQAWWQRTTAYRAYVVALQHWQARKAAYARWLARTRARPAPVHSTPLATAPPDERPVAPAATVAATPSGSDTGIFGAAPPGRSGAVAQVSGSYSAGALQVEQASAMLEPAEPALTPIFGPPVAQPSAALSFSTSTAGPTPPETVTPAPTETVTPPVATSTPLPSSTPAPSATETPTATATIVPPSATATRRPTEAPASPSATATEPAATGTSQPTATASPSPAATASSTDTATPAPTQAAPAATSTPEVIAPPGPPPAAVPPPGLEPEMAPLPPPVVPLPGWVRAPQPVPVPSINLHSLPPLYATGHAEMTRAQLIADGALDAGGFIPPIQGVITTFWGGSTPWQSFHPGLDIAAPKDTPVHAAADGVVVYAGLSVPGEPTMEYGNCVMIEHYSGLVTLYGHMDMGQFGLQVQVGEVVHQGQIIGYEGQTGWATGPHVHFEMRVDNVQFNPLLLLNLQQITGQ